MNLHCRSPRHADMRRAASGWLAILSTLLSSCLLSGTALSQAYPARPITLIVSSAPGGGVDFFARILADRLRPRLEQTVIVDNRPGASGMIAAGLAAKAAPDGYTMFIMPNTLVFAPYVLSKGASTVNVITQLAPVVMPVSVPMLLAVNAKAGVRSISDLIASAKKEKGLAYTGGSNGAPMHIIGEQFNKTLNLEMIHVPYKGTAQALTAAIAGQVSVIWMTTSAGNVKHFKSGTLLPLAVTSPRRSPLLPDVPTTAELGYKEIEGVAWFGILAPVGTPAAVIGRLNSEVNAILALPDMRDRLIPAGYVIEGGGPEVLAAQMRKDDAYYRKVIAEFGIKSD